MREAVIYKIRSTIDEYFYIGSSFNFDIRKKKHLTEIFTKVSRKVYDHFSKIGEENLIFDIIATYEVENENEKRECEQKHIDELMNEWCLNMRRAYTGININNNEDKKGYDKEYYKQYKDEHQQRCKEYNKKNKDKIKEHKAKKYQENIVENRQKRRDYGANHREEAILRVKQWAENNKERIKERNKKIYAENKTAIQERLKKYQQEHKEEISARRSAKICCPVCNELCSLRNISRHNNSKSHIINFIQY